MKNRTIEKDIPLIALEAFREITKIPARWEEGGHQEAGWVVFHARGKDYRLPAQVKKSFPAHQLHALVEQPLPYPGSERIILITDYLQPKARESLRQAGFNYMDTTGNLYLESEGIMLFIDRQGKKKRLSGTTGSPFTKKGTALIGYYLIDPPTINLTRRDLAKRTGFSLGTVSESLTGLIALGFVREIGGREYRLFNLDRLLNRWAEGYFTKIKPDMYRERYRLPRGKKWQDLQLPDGCSWGGEPGAENAIKHMKAVDLTLYSTLSRADMVRFKLLPHPDGEIIVYRPFMEWSGKVAPLPVLYADLFTSGDPRSIETAMEIKKKIIDEWDA